MFAGVSSAQRTGGSSTSKFTILAAMNNAVFRKSNALPACLGNGNPNRLVSLWDIVNHFKASDFCTRVGNLAILEARFQKENPSTMSVERWAQLGLDFAAQIIHAANDCHDVGLTHAWEEINRINTMLVGQEKNAEANTMAARHVRHCLVAELQKRKFLFIKDDRAEFLDCGALFGDVVERNFPSAKFDIREVGNCLACELYTASVFHLMRSVEWGLRALGTDLGLRRLRTRSKKANKPLRYTPLAWSQWEEIILQLKCRIASRIAAIRRGPRKQEYQEFYSPAVDQIERFKDAYRNHVMHTRREYTRSEAYAVFDQVRHFMTHLATRLSEC